MTLPKPETDRFYKLWFALLEFVNERRNIVPSLSGKLPQGQVDSNLAIKVRDVVWKSNTLIDQFVAENPAQLSAEDLQIVGSWKHRRTGTFIIYKALKKHAIFISQDNQADVFTVKGLVSSFEEMFGAYIPIMVEAVLLPFKDEIITDGLFQPYNVSFGSGIRANLKDIYDDAKERGAIITNLLADQNPPSRESQTAKAEATNAKVLDAFQRFQYQSRLSSKTIERDMGNVSGAAQYLLQNQAEPVSLRDFTREALLSYLASLPEKERKTRQLSLKRFITFLQETARLDWGEAEAMLEELKS